MKIEITETISVPGKHTLQAGSFVDSEAVGLSSEEVAKLVKEGRVKVKAVKK